MCVCVRLCLCVCVCVSGGGGSHCGMKSKRKDGLLGTCVPSIWKSIQKREKNEVMKRRFCLDPGESRPMKLFLHFLISHSSTNPVLRVAGNQRLEENGAFTHTHRDTHKQELFCTLANTNSVHSSNKPQ